MANQNNFKENTTQLSQDYIKYTVSRVIQSMSDNLLEMEVPATFPSEVLGNNIEINLYSLVDNSLIYSDFISNKTLGAVTVNTLQYTSGSRNLLFIDFSKITDLVFPSGQYSATLNFFSDEVGSYDNRVLKVSNISPSRKEVELELTDISQLEYLTKFAIPYISAEYVENAIKQIFNQPESLNLDSNTTGSQITSQSIASQFTATMQQDIITYGFDTGSGNQPGVYQIAQSVLDQAYIQVLGSIKAEILKGTKNFTSVYLNTIIQDAISKEYNKVVSNQPYRFVLL